MGKNATPESLLPCQIHEVHNALRDGTITDAIGRHVCRVALGELCIGDDMPGGLRYPTRAEVKEAKNRVASQWNRMFGIE